MFYIELNNSYHKQNIVVDKKYRLQNDKQFEYNVKI